MRLTLRTLLAYLDDVLEPSQAKEIGEKIQESSFASGLVSRIREVMRRRRLTAPALSGPGSGIDPNTVAEYLDNTLPPESIADVEKICLDSDVHLAEVGACHQVLTLALGEPVEIAPESRERMYALGPSAIEKIGPANKFGAEPEPVRVPVEPGGSAAMSESSVSEIFSQAPDVRGGEMLQPAPAGTAVAPDATHDTIPDYLRPRPLWQRVAPYAVVALLLAGWITLISMDSLFVNGGNKSESTAPNAQSANSNAPNGTAGQGKTGVEVVQGDVPPPLPSLAPPAADIKPEPAGTAPDGRQTIGPDMENQPSRRAGSSEVALAAPKRGGIDAPPPADAPDEETAPVPPVQNSKSKPILPDAAPGESKPDSAAPGKASVETDEPQMPTKPNSKKPVGAVAVRPDTPPRPAAEPEPRKPGIAEVPPAKYVSTEGVMLHYVPKENNWFVLARRSLVLANDRLAVPEPFEEVIEVDQDRGAVRLLGGASVRISEPTEAAPFGFELVRGRVIIKRKENSGDSEQPLKIALEVRGETWLIELPTPDTICGIDVVPREPSHFEQDLGPNTYFGSIYAAEGTVNVIDAAQQRHVVAAPGAFTLTPELRAGAIGAGKAEIPVSTTVPKWLLQPSQSSAARQYAKPFEKEFDAAEPVDLSIAGFVNERRPEMSRLAVECLGLVGADGALIDALQRTDHEEARKAAIGALRIWLPLAPEHRERLKTELAKHFSPENADVVYRLLWGYNEDDARNRVISTQLVDWMESEETVIRELAFFHVHRLTDKKFEYRANASAQQRQLAVSHWRQHIMKTGALLAVKK